jgi:hypothetical protein
MKCKSYSEAQVLGFLKEAKSGIPVKELCRKHGFSDASFYNWQKTTPLSLIPNNPNFYFWLICTSIKVTLVQRVHSDVLQSISLQPLDSTQ